MPNLFEAAALIGDPRESACSSVLHALAGFRPGGRVTFLGRPRKVTEGSRPAVSPRCARSPALLGLPGWLPNLAAESPFLFAMKPQTNGARSVLASALRAQPGSPALLGDTEGNDRRLRSTAQERECGDALLATSAAIGEHTMEACRRARRHADARSVSVTSPPNRRTNPNRLRGELPRKAPKASSERFRGDAFDFPSPLTAPSSAGSQRDWAEGPARALTELRCSRMLLPRTKGRVAQRSGFRAAQGTTRSVARAAGSPFFGYFLWRSKESNPPAGGGTPANARRRKRSPQQDAKAPTGATP